MNDNPTQPHGIRPEVIAKMHEIHRLMTERFLEYLKSDKPKRASMMNEIRMWLKDNNVVSLPGFEVEALRALHTPTASIEDLPFRNADGETEH